MKRVLETAHASMRVRADQHGGHDEAVPSSWTQPDSGVGRRKGLLLIGASSKPLARFSMLTGNAAAKILGNGTVTSLLNQARKLISPELLPDLD